MNFNLDLNAVLNMVLSAGAIYAAIRADMAALKVRVEHLERDLYKEEK